MNIKKFFLSMFITILVLVTMVAGLMAANFFFGTNLSDEIAKYLDKISGGTVNVLLLGLDEDKTRADVIMVVSIDPNEHDIHVLSIPRDTRVRYAEGRYDKINHAMGYKNPEERIISLVKQVTGMPIHYYCEVGFAGFREVIDILGGVEFDVPVNMHYEDPAQKLSIHVNKGLQVLDGKKAEGVVRYRATYVTGDEQRINVQKDFLHALFEQKLNAKYLAKAPALINEIYQHVETNFSPADAIKYAKSFKKMTAESLKTHTLPGESGYVNGVSYFIYDPAETRELILTEFGYPEDEAAALKQQEKQAGLAE
ncbi:MAG: LytR family transcriptional regulator [Ruminococcaceae bacterium]|nr:LytR family transcriptional regulator [Oscillospiraceae bacterium]